MTRLEKLLCLCVILLGAGDSIVGGWQVFRQPGWEDLRFSASQVAFSTANNPTWVNYSGNLWTLGFDDIAGDDCVTFDPQWPHTRLLGSDARPHIHDMSSTTATCDVVWKIYYNWCDNGEVCGAETSDTVTSSWDGTQHTLFVNSWSTIDGSGATDLSSMMSVTVCRDGGNGADTCNGLIAYYREVDFHFEQDTERGSQEELVK